MATQTVGDDAKLSKAASEAACQVDALANAIYREADSNNVIDPYQREIAVRTLAARVMKLNRFMLSYINDEGADVDSDLVEELISSEVSCG